MTPPRIMIVDDEPDLVRALGLRLRAAGYQILVAADGLRATQLAIREKPSLIILDIGMPGGDGHTVARRIKNNMETMTIPLIFMTARTAPEDESQAYEEGAVAFLRKPFKTEDLLAAVERALKPVDAIG